MIVKKIARMTAAALAAAMMLTACGSSGDSSSGKEGKASETTAKAAETTAATEAEPEPIERKINEFDPDKPVIALTFDDGPNTVTTPQVLDMLEKYDVVGSFFLIGQNIAEENYEVIKRAYSMGCDIENHSFTHSNFTTMTVDDFTKEVEDTDRLIMDIIGEKPAFFRAPYTYANTDMYENIDKCFISGFGCNDWEETTTVQDRIDKTLEQAADGAVILLHDAEGNQQTVEALDTIIPELQAQGYQLVTISQLFEAKGRDPREEIYKYRQISNVIV